MVANRFPITWSATAGWERSPGGLVTALEAHVRRHRVTWIGSSASLGDAGGATPAWPHGRLLQVPVDRDQADLAIGGMSDSCLWPALHGLAERVQWRDDWWEAYRLHNEHFARTIAEGVPVGALVWIHGHHLLLVPQMVAPLRADLRVALSIHAPCEAAALTELPVADQLVAALDQPAVIAVQTAADRSQLVEFCARRRGVTIVSPASIDPEDVTTLVDEQTTKVLVERLRSGLQARRLIVGIDRIDRTKALTQRLDAIDRAFRHGSIRPDEVEIVQIAQPTRTGLSASRELRLDLERRAHEVASHWLRSDGTPALRVVTEGRGRREVAALLAAADLALVTPARDGMNLVAKEFSICNEARAGVLVLSRTAGVADALGDASVLVDGADAASVAEGIARAVTLDPETRRRMARRRADAVRAWTSEHWAADVGRRLTTARVSADHRPG